MPAGTGRPSGRPHLPRRVVRSRPGGPGRGAEESPSPLTRGVRGIPFHTERRCRRGGGEATRPEEGAQRTPPPPPRDEFVVIRGRAPGSGDAPGAFARPGLPARDRTRPEVTSHWDWRRREEGPGSERFRLRGGGARGGGGGAVGRLLSPGEGRPGGRRARR